MTMHGSISLTSGCKVLPYCSCLLCFSAEFYVLVFGTLNTSQVGPKEVSTVTTLRCLQNTRLYDSVWLVLMLIQHRIKRGATAGF